MASQTHPLPQPESDEALVARLLKGEGAAFNSLYDRYFPRVYAHLVKAWRDQSEVERGVEEVLRRVLSSLEDFRRQDPHVSFAAWVLGVTRGVQRETGGDHGKGDRRSWRRWIRFSNSHRN